MGCCNCKTSVGWLVVCFLLLSVSGWAQRPAPLITQTVDDQSLIALRGNTHPLAQKKFDQGAAPASMPMHRMMLVLQRSPQQEHALVTLLDSQQDKSSPNYHQWLTPDQFGQQFGPADSDVQTVTSWLQLHGFQVARVSRGKTIVEFDGTAGQVQQAFHTSIHSYLVNGEQHWANASDPQIPAALAPVVAGPMSLNNFFPKAQNQFGGVFSKAKTSPKLTPVTPQLTFSCMSNTCYGVVPYDFATIYNVLPLWNAGVDGTGQTIAIVGQTNINIQDVRDFRSLFGLPAHDPNIILNGPDPGINSDEGEADIDVQWSGAVAKGATIDLVVSEGTETTAGIDLSAEYIIDNDLAPVMSESYGGCERAFGTAGNQFYNALWEQAAAQGITVMISTGDSGSAGCDQNSGTAAQFGLAVNGIASTPFTVAVGGTDFSQFSNPQTYWGSVNNPTTQESAVGYIPETTWNDSCTNSLLASLGFSANAETNCNNSTLLAQGLGQAVGGSGGSSNCTINSQQSGTCAGGYTKPSWQSGNGISDGKRDLPDVSLFASNGFEGSYYIVCQSDLSLSGMCDVTAPFTDLAGYGGTSVASPAFAGIMALVNQGNGRQGNANYVLYKLAAQQNAANCNSSNNPASSCMFNDVTAGTIAMPCTTGSPNCTTSTTGHQFGILSGYSTGVGYDLATGLGTVNAANLVNNWSSITFTPSATTLSLSPTSGLTHGQPVTATIAVSPSSATGDVSLITSTGKGIAQFTLSGGQISKSTTLLPGGTYSVHAHYAGDGTYAASDSLSVNVTVAKENSTTALSLITFNSQGQITNSHATTAPYGSPYIYRIDVTASSGVVCGPLANCPTGTLTVTNNGNPLDPMFFNGVLNSLGYTEDQPVQFPGGSNTVVANYPGDSSFNASSATATYAITPATTSMTAVTYTPSSVSSGVPFTVSTTVQTSSSGLAPSGAVKFFGNGTQLTGTVAYTPTAGSAAGNASLLAQLTTTVSAGGNYALTASYGGDGNYSASSATGPTLPVDTDFSLPTSLAPITIASPGGSGQTTLTITGQSSYTGTVNFSATSCTALPAGAHCSFSPASVTGTGSTTLTVTTTAPSAAAKRAGLAGFNWWMTGTGTMAFGVVLLGGTAKKRWTSLLGLAVFVLLLFLPACGGGSSGGGGGNPGTPIGSYNVTVTATSGSLSHNTTFMLIVQ